MRPTSRKWKARQRATAAWQRRPEVARRSDSGPPAAASRVILRSWEARTLEIWAVARVLMLWAPGVERVPTVSPFAAGEGLW